MKSYISYFKHLVFIGVVIIFSTITVYADSDDQVIFWDGRKIPDAAFRSYLLDRYDKNGNGEISEREWRKGYGSVSDVNISGMGIKSLEGYPFERLCGLDCSHNNLISLDLTISLSYASYELLNCSDNKLTSLNLIVPPSSSDKGWALNCSWNELTFLDLSNVRDLYNLNCSNNNLTSLVFSSTSEVSKLDCSNNNFTSLYLSSTPDLRYLDCSNNNLTSLDLSYTSDLTYLNCSGNNLTALDLSEPHLAVLDCSNNNLTSLDLSDQYSLIELNCSGNNLTTLDLSENDRLKKLYVSSNQLNAVSKNNYEIIRKIEIYVDGKKIFPENIKKLHEQYFADMQRKKAREREVAERRRAENARYAQQRQEAGIRAEKGLADEYKKGIVSYVSNNDWNGADAYAKEALDKLSYGDAYLYFVRAKAYYINNLDFNLGTHESATPYFEVYRSEAQHLVNLCTKSINLDKSNSNEAYFYRGIGHIILRQLGSASDDFRKCMEDNPSMRGVCYYNIGIALKNAQRHQSAIDSFKKAREYYTSESDKQKALSQIKDCSEEIEKSRNR